MPLMSDGNYERHAPRTFYRLFPWIVGAEWYKGEVVYRFTELVAGKRFWLHGGPGAAAVTRQQWIANYPMWWAEWR
jgi:hypothetical protein